jgi:hypothetical protein
MSSLDDASSLHYASEFSALIAPVIDRVAISVHNAIDKASVASLRGELKFSPAALALFAGPLAHGPMTRREYDQLTRYQHFGSSEDFLNGLADRGAVELTGDGNIVPTADGMGVSRRLIELQASTVNHLFAPRANSLRALSISMDTAQHAAASDPNSMLSRVFARSWLPADASDAARMWNASVVLRMHRSDAHAAAWTEAGQTLETIRTMPPSPARDAIEDRTNELAAVPWEPLTAGERLSLLAGLAALPGTGAPVP